MVDPHNTISVAYDEKLKSGMEKKHQSEVVVLGAWGITFCSRVELALKLKGIEYEYVEEDLTNNNKSESLKHYNPVHKKVPVLVHQGKPIAESLIILEYIDEQWNHSPKLLPQDPYERAKVRFWANFWDQKIFPTINPIIFSEGKEQETAMKEFSDLLSVLEQGIDRDFPKGSVFNGETLGFLDIVIGINAYNIHAFEETVGITVDPSKHAAFLSWADALTANSLMKDTLPPRHKYVAKFTEFISAMTRLAK